jgi:feruloyl esterase
LDERKGQGRRHVPWRLGTSLGLVVLASCATPLALSNGAPDDSQVARCNALTARVVQPAPVDGLVIRSAEWRPDGSRVTDRGSQTAPLPAHCELNGHFGERAGTLGQTYRTGFQMRLPGDWNGRFLFQGGGGSNGVIRAATGANGPGNRSALERGYAVIAQDSGHDNRTNNLPTHQGELVFGFDPQARRDYGHASLEPVNRLAHHLMRAFYGRDSSTNLFWGCSKGGQEGLAFAQRYPDAFDGIVAAAPGLSLPRAAVQQAWDTQRFADVLRARREMPTVNLLHEALNLSNAAVVSDAIVAACDGLDASQDGMVSAIGQCKTALVLPELRRRQCAVDAAADNCLEPAQIDALVAVMGGAHDSGGRPIYAPFAWDPGIGQTGWLAWKTGLAGGPVARNVVLGGGSLAAVFMTPPMPLAADADSLLKWQLAFDFDRDTPQIYAVAPPFRTSAWQDVGMRSTDLSKFRAGGGKLIVPHGMADPVFSALDTIDWWQEVDRRQGGRASDFVRVFPVPGMNHCAGGAATDRYDTLGALEDWVLRDKAPDTIEAVAGPESPWPGRKRPLCPYPMIAKPVGAPGSQGGEALICS